jgi:hypothetical protein
MSLAASTSVPMSEGISLVMVRNRKAEADVVVGRALQILDGKDRLDPDGCPTTTPGRHLLVTLHLQPVEAAVTDRDVPMGEQAYPVLDCFSAACRGSQRHTEIVAIPA